jgi:hypothetical protein
LLVTGWPATGAKTFGGANVTKRLNSNVFLSWDL